MEVTEKKFAVKKVCSHCKTALLEYQLAHQEIERQWTTLALTGAWGKRCPNDCCAGYSQYVQLEVWDEGRKISLDDLKNSSAE
jgi:hypothetical protein